MEGKRRFKVPTPTLTPDMVPRRRIAYEGLIWNEREKKCYERGVGTSRCSTQHLRKAPVPSAASAAR